MHITLPYSDKLAKCDIDLSLDSEDGILIIRYGDLDTGGERQVVAVEKERWAEFLRAVSFLMKQEG